ncbi:hypothetical protein EJB05_15361, partial [Eragrostis curvula]
MVPSCSRGRPLLASNGDDDLHNLPRLRCRRPFPGRCSRVAPTRHDYQGRGKGDQAKTSMGLWNALAFSGLAPEHINGRLTMVSFVSAIAVEASTHNGRLTMVGFVSAIAVEASTHGDGLFAQAASGTGQAWFTYMVAVLPPAVAPLVPLLQGESVEARSGGIITSPARSSSTCKLDKCS